MIRVHLICISGFSQNLGDDNGTHALWERLREYQNKYVQVHICTWNDDWKGRAEIIHGFSEPNALILVAAYSWGAGHGLKQLAKYLKKRGRDIDAAIYCDPVYRSRLFTFRWLAFIRLWKLRVPDNVRKAWWFFQRNGYPMGHLPKNPEQPRIVSIQPMASDTHMTIDEAPKYHDTVLKQAQKLVEMSTQRAKTPDKVEG